MLRALRVLHAHIAGVDVRAESIVHITQYQHVQLKRLKHDTYLSKFNKNYELLQK